VSIIELEWITPEQAAEKWSITTRQVQALCKQGHITNAVHIGRVWLIPKNVPKPIDGRTKGAKAMKAKTGWERENRTHFDEIVVNSDKARWEYPAELYADIMDFSRTDGKKAVEIGAGTGIATVPFLDAGYKVTAVETGANMASFFEERFKNNSYFSGIVADFETAELPENEYDLVYAASAFHWVNAKIGCPKVFKILKSGGTFALFRNNAVPRDDNELYEEIQAVYNKYYYKSYKPYPRPIRIMDMTVQDFFSARRGSQGFSV
jgi:SAM-dependent methyltransferase